MIWWLEQKQTKINQTFLLTLSNFSGWITFLEQEHPHLKQLLSLFQLLVSVIWFIYMIWFSNLFYYFAFLSSSFRVTISVSLSPISYFTVLEMFGFGIVKVEITFFYVLLFLSFLIVFTAFVLCWLHFLMSLSIAYNLLVFLVGEFYITFSKVSSSNFIFFWFYFSREWCNYLVSILSLE